MTPAMKLAFVIGELAAFVLGLGLRPVLLDLRDELRFRRHLKRCDHCRRVVASNGPRWLLCGEGRGLPPTRPSERQLRAALRASAGVPERRSDGN